MEEYSKEYIINELTKICIDDYKNERDDLYLIEATIDLINHDTFWHEVNIKKYKQQMNELHIKYGKEITKLKNEIEELKANIDKLMKGSV